MKITFTTNQSLVLDQVLSPMRSITDRAEVITFIKQLHYIGLTHHFDDEISSIPNFTDTFSARDLKRFDKNVTKMLDVCERLHICPFDIALRVSNCNDPDSDWYNKQPVNYETDTTRASDFYFNLISLKFKSFVNRDKVLGFLATVSLSPQCAEETLAFEEAVERFETLMTGD